MAIIDLTLAHADETDVFSISVMERKGWKTQVTRRYWAPEKDPDVLFVDSWLSMFAHCGTHIDAPRHIFRSGKTVDEIELDRFIGEACVLDFSSKAPDEAITSSDLAPHVAAVRPGDIALLRTDWSDKKWGSMEYMYGSPFLTADAAEWLVARKVKAAGFDFVQEEEVKRIPDNKPENNVVHRILLGNGVIQVEHLANLGKIPTPRCQFIALPLKLVGVEGSPCRAVAIAG
jgi:kynurenine formamidase